jgi:hypothetical protein
LNHVEERLESLRIEGCAQRGDPLGRHVVYRGAYSRRHFQVPIENDDKARGSRLRRSHSDGAGLPGREPSRPHLELDDSGNVGPRFALRLSSFSPYAPFLWHQVSESAGLHMVGWRSIKVRPAVCGFTRRLGDAGRRRRF